MPPIMSRQQKDPKKTDEKGLISRVKYNNTLPDFPFDPKFIVYPFDPDRYVHYKPTSLETNHKHDLLTEQDLGVTVDLVDSDVYTIPPEYQAHGGVMPLPLEDEKLLEEEVTPQNDAKRSRQHNKVIPWLKKTEYISTEFNRYGACSEKTETKVGYNVKKKMKEDPLYLDKEGQIAAIDKTFEDAKKEITEHHSKKGVVPVAVYDVFPDFERWKYPFAQVQFDADPAPMSQSEEMRQAMIRGVMDESGEQFVAYFLPTKETLGKRKRDKDLGVEYVEDEEYEYDMTREYNWNVKSKTSKGYEENYFFIFDDKDKRVYYNELETRVRLSKRRSKTESHATNSKLVVKHRPPVEQEEYLQKLRLRMLEKPMDDDDEDEKNAGDDDQESNKNDEDEERGGREDGDDEDVKDKKPSRETSPSSESASGSSSSGSDEEMEEPSLKRKPQEEIFGESESDSD